MTPKEKALELVKKYHLQEIDVYIGSGTMTYESAKQCALMAVDEIIEELKSIELNYNLNFQTDLLPYYLEVKTEIENL